MKPLIIIIVILIGGIIWWTQSKTESPAETESTNSAVDTSQTAPAEETLEPTEIDQTDEIAEEEADDTIASTKVFNLSGVNFAFDVEEIRVQEGDTVTINFESAEGFHDWVVDEFDAATDKVRPGTPTSVTFVADTAGTYEYYCSVGNHRAEGMVGSLIVE